MQYHSIKNTESFTLKNKFSPPFRFSDEIKYYFKRIAVDVIIGVPVLVGLGILLLFRKWIQRKVRRKIIFGTVPIIIFKTYNSLLAKSFDTTLFVMDDWSKGAFHDGVQLKDIAPSMISKSPYVIGPYYAFVWAIWHFELFFLYFDSGFLERTIWWRVEPILLQLYKKKIVMVPYGSDVWAINEMRNVQKKFGLGTSQPKYFALDSKRMKRNTWWCKYATVVFAIVDFIKYLPRADVVTLHGHIILDEKEIGYCPFEKGNKIKILHIANDKYRKGSLAINQILLQMSKFRDDFEYEIITGVDRTKVIQKMNEVQIIIDTPIDGFIQYTTMEAALKGKVVLTRLDHELEVFFKYINPDYYQKHFEEMPIIDIDLETLEDRLLELLDNPSMIEKISIETRIFAQKIIKENSDFLVRFVHMVLR